MKKNTLHKPHGFMIIMALVLAVSAIVINRIWAASSDEVKPAVAAINAKVDGGYADFDAASTKFGSASLTLPLGNRFGVSIDGLGGDYSADKLWGVGGTLFWRDPTIGLIGIAGSNVQAGATNGYRSGLTGELYLGKFSVLGDIGYLDGDNLGGNVFVDAQLRWYPIDNLAVGAGCAFANSVTAGLISAEFMPKLKILSGLSIFVDGSWGENGYHSVMTGARYYFGGGERSLKAKHREVDPPNHALQGLVLCAQGNCFEDKDVDSGPTPSDIITDDIKGDDLILVDDIVTP